MLRPKSLHPLRLVAFLFVVLLASCSEGGCVSGPLCDDGGGGGGGGGDTLTPTSIAVSVETISFNRLGATQQVSATVSDQNQNAMSGQPLTWSTSDASVATVDGSGTIGAVGNGSADVTATSGSLTATVTVAVRQIPTEVSVAPDPIFIGGLGNTVTLTATVRDGGGAQVQVPDLTWGSNNSSVATVSASGVVTAVAVGNTSITVQASFQGSSSVGAAVGVTVSDMPVVLQSTDFCADFSSGAIVTFADTNLENVVRAALGLAAQDDLTCGLAGALAVLHAGDLAISNLAGIQNLTGLTELELLDNSITDVSPLATLTSLVTVSIGGNSDLRDITSLSTLTSLVILELSNSAVTSISAVSAMTSLTDLYVGGNSINDVSPLLGRTSLMRLALDGNNISDITPLSGLTNLVDLDLGATGRADISALSGLAAMQFLFLDDNAITDVSPLQGMTQLAYVDLEGNPNLSDIQPLLDNTGLGSGDEVLLGSTAVDCADVTALKNNGVTVTSDCDFLAPQVTTTSLPSGVENADYGTQTLTASGRNLNRSVDAPLLEPTERDPSPLLRGARAR